MKFLIITTDSKLLEWKTLKDKIKDIEKTLHVWDVTIGTYKGQPKIKGDRIDRDWLEDISKRHFDKGYDVVGLHMSQTQARKWGINKSLRGSNPIRDNELGDFYFSADENRTRNGEDRFTQVCLHEFSHEFFQQTGLPDRTHEYHDKNPDIRGLFKSFNWSLYQPQRMKLKKVKTLLEKAVELLELWNTLQKKTLIHPVSDYSSNISQAYGVRNKRWYPTSHRHNGTDYACPVGTKVVAPIDGQVTASGWSDSMGNYCYYRYTHQGKIFVERYMHLSTIPKLGTYKQGVLLGKTGDTGKVTGAHLHLEVWKNEVRLDLLTPKNWNTLTVNPETHYS